MPRQFFAVMVLLASASLLLMGATGCKSVKGGRIDPSQTTRAERGSGLILPEALLEFSDQAPRRLAADLSRIPEVSSLDRRATIILGDINNQTDAVSTSEFEMMHKRLRSNLINSDIARDRLSFVERRARMGRLAEREQVGTIETPVGPAAYDPRSTFTLNGDMYRVGRSGDNDMNLYYMEFTLVSFASNEVLWSDRYEVKQIKGN